jgi:hypothetical protein
MTKSFMFEDPVASGDKLDTGDGVRIFICSKVNGLGSMQKLDRWAMYRAYQLTWNIGCEPGRQGHVSGYLLSKLFIRNANAIDVNLAVLAFVAASDKCLINSRIFGRGHILLPAPFLELR